MQLKVKSFGCNLSVDFKTMTGADIESRGSGRWLKSGDLSDDDGGFSPFDITTTKNAPIDRLRRWRKAAIVLKASRRFRYTLDWKKEEEKKEITRKIRKYAQVVQAANLFKEANERAKVTQEYPDVPRGDYEVMPEELACISKDHGLSVLQLLGGVIGLAIKLKSNWEKGIPGNEEDMLQRKNVFGSNTYPPKKGRSFWWFLWEAYQNWTVIILIVVSVASLAFDIISEPSLITENLSSFKM